jgi:regulator of protease activity HflC (stomatin/prohibitin superfamily)
MDVLTRIWDWLVEKSPLQMIESWEQGVRFRNGVPDEKPLGAGWWFIVPFFWRIENLPVMPRYIDLPTQSCTTAAHDGTASTELTFSANICYEIANAVLAYTTIHDYEDYMSRLAMGHLHERVSEWTYAEIMADRKKLQRSCRETLSTRAEKAGIRILDVKLTDMVRTRALRLYNL